MGPTKLFQTTNDSAGWGLELFRECVRRGWECNLSNRLGTDMDPRPDYIFLRLSSYSGLLSRERNWLQKLAAANHHLILDLELGQVHEDRIAQAKHYTAWSPRTVVLESLDSAMQELGRWQQPFLSKSRTGPGNIRPVNTRDDALREIQAAFDGGLAIRDRHGEKLQKGYLIWSEYMPGEHYQVVATGRMRMMLHHVDGRLRPVEEMTDEARKVLAFADAFFKERHWKWGGIEVVIDHGGKCKLLEVAASWKHKDYRDCQYFNSDAEPEEYVGCEMWRLLADEIEEGVFG